jgi:hypothetical protein
MNASVLAGGRGDPFLAVGLLPSSAYSVVADVSQKRRTAAMRPSSGGPRRGA